MLKLVGLTFRVGGEQAHDTVTVFAGPAKVKEALFGQPESATEMVTCAC